MAPLPPNNTPRFRWHYTTMGHQHTIQLRSHESPGFLGGLMDNYFSALGVTCAGIVLDNVEFAPSGSDIFNPVVTGIEGTLYTGGSFLPENEAWAYTFIGRTTGGRRVRITQYGALFLGNDYRIIAGESSPIDAAIAVLVGASGSIRGIDDLTPVWKTYVDCQVNDHWVKQLRP